MNTKRRCSEELFESRKARALKLLELRAPDVVIATEARLLCQGFHGGKWANALDTIVEALRDTWEWRIAAPVTRLLCWLDLYHNDLGMPGAGCVVCGKGRSQEFIDLDAEYADEV